MPQAGQRRPPREVPAGRLVDAAAKKFNIYAIGDPPNIAIEYTSPIARHPDAGLAAQFFRERFMVERMSACLTRLRRDRSAATAIEYGLIAALISITVVVWALSIGTSVSGFFTDVANGF